MKKFLFLILLIGSVAANAQEFNKSLQDELLKMQDVDQKARNECTKGAGKEEIKCVIEIAEKIDKPNTKRLEEIYRQYGFPTFKTVGKDGVEAFMLVLQHAPDDSLRLKCIKPIKKAFKRKEVSPSEYTGFVDRLRIHQGKLQIYGSNFDFKDGKLVMTATTDPKNLERRRKKVGLPPIIEYAKMLHDAYNLEVVVPTLK